MGKLITSFIVFSFLLFSTTGSQAGETIRAGIVGLDTSHVIAFTKGLNDPKAKGDMADIKIVAAFPGGSPDIAASRERIAGFTKQLKAMDVEIVGSIDELLKKVDVILLESVDGRPHYQQAAKVIKAGKPLFIDKPLAGSLSDAIAIFRLAEKHKVPCFSSSSLRFGAGIQKILSNPKVGDIIGCTIYSPCSYEPHHPDLFWYGIHGVEMLYTIMGSGCQRVQRTSTKGVDVVVGTWKNGRVATYRGIRRGKATYGGVVFGTKGIIPVGKYGGYQPLLQEIATFFKTKKPPVDSKVTIELYAFMQAADESKRQGGKSVSIREVIQKATLAAEKKLAGK